MGRDLKRTSEGLKERTMQIHLQRIVGAYVGSAHGAGQFYFHAVTNARDETTKGPLKSRWLPSANLSRHRGRKSPFSPFLFRQGPELVVSLPSFW
jgi:hypothetical protein